MAQFETFHWSLGTFAFPGTAEDEEWESRHGAWADPEPRCFAVKVVFAVLYSGFLQSPKAQLCHFLGYSQAPGCCHHCEKSIPVRSDQLTSKCS